MSQNLSNKIRGWHPKQPLGRRDWRALVIFPAWVFAAFISAQLIVAAVVRILTTSGFDFAKYGSSTAIETVLAATIYTLAIGIAIGAPYLLGRRVDLEQLGLRRLMTWLDIGLAPIAYIVYILVLVGVISAVTNLIPIFQADQAQDVGFKSLTNQSGYLLAFVTLVVIAPIAEEVLFRGYLYGKLRRHIPIWAAIMATSILFAAVHGQWNVAVDTFILSVVMCGLRELTGSIWSGILVHMIKNGIAFYILFIAPVVAPGMGS